jgi:hypothetical protein
MTNANLLSLSPKTMDKIARVDRLVRMEQPLYLACKTVGITVEYYRKVKNKIEAKSQV